MAIKDVFKVSRKTFVDPKNWLAYDTVKVSTGILWRATKSVFFTTPPSAPVQQETFDEAMQRQGLSEDDVKSSVRTYLLFSMGFGALAIGIVVLALYFFSRLLIADGVIALSIASFLFAQAFVFNFWCFQMKMRKLGCSFAEWRQGKLND